MSKKICTIGYRNGLFVGQVQQPQEDTYIASGIGLVLDDMFITCLSSWYAQSKDSTTKPKGPALILYPHKQILYAEQYPFNNKLRGIWCFVVSNIKIFGNGQDSYLAVLHTTGQIISKIKIKDRRQIETNQEIQYNSQEQKWKIISQIIGCKVPDSKKQTYRFIEEHFQKKIPSEQRQAHFYNMHKRNMDYFGIVSSNQGLIFSIKTNEHNIEVGSVGYYNEVQTKMNMQFGRVYLDETNSSTWRIEEGNYENNQIYQYQSNEKRPLQSVKTSRNYFRQATSFSNKFLQFSQASEVYERLTKISKQYATKISSKYGQRIIEGNNTSFTNHRREREYEEQKKRQINKQELFLNGEDIINREYNLQEARANIENMINRRKNDHSTNKKTANFTEMPNHYNQDDENSNKKYRFQDKTKNKDVSPLTRSIYNEIGGIGGTSRVKSPRRSSPRKYTYSDLQNQAADQKKQKNYPQFIHNDHFKEEFRKIYTVNEFTLYPNANVSNENKNEDRIKQQRQKILKDFQNRKQRLQLQRQKPNLMTGNRQILRENQKNMELDPFSYRNAYRMITQNLHTYPEPNRYYPNHYEQISMIGSAGYKRKFFNNYNYMEDKGATKQNPSPIKTSIAASSKIERPVVTPITKTSNYETRDKSPVSMKPTARKIYSYMD